MIVAPRAVLRQEIILCFCSLAMYEANSAEFTKVLDKELLKSYWLSNKETILSLDFSSKGKRVFTGNYSASYKEDLKDVCRVLDELNLDTQMSSTLNSNKISLHNLNEAELLLTPA